MCTCRGSTAESGSRTRLHNDAAKDFSELSSDQKNSNHRRKRALLFGCSSEVTLIAVGVVIPRCTCCCFRRTQAHRDRQPGTPCDLPWETTCNLYHPSEMILLTQALPVFTLVNNSKSRTLMSFCWGWKKKKKGETWACPSKGVWSWSRLCFGCETARHRLSDKKGKIKNKPERSLGLEMS